MYCHTILSRYKLIQRSRPPSPRHSFTSRPPPSHLSPLCVKLCTISLTAFSLFSLSFHLIKRLWFWRQCSKFILQGDFSIFYVETTLSSFKGRLAPLHWFSCLVFVRKLDSGVRRHDCVSCTHFARYLQSPLSFASANSRSLLHFWSRKCRLKNVEHSLRFCFVPLLSLSSPFHTHPVLFILCSWKVI